MSEPVLLGVEDLQVHFPVPRRHFLSRRPTLRAVDGVSFRVTRGRTFGVVGESGSGKTTTALAVLRLVRATAGRALFDGVDLLSLDAEAMRRMRRRLQVIFQDPFSSLNPRCRAGDIVREPMDVMRLGSHPERAARVDELFSAVGLRPEQQSLFPHQFSGGQRQRIGIARALATRPQLVVCDEPVSALDVAIQAQILNLLNRLQDQLGLTYLVISHDLAVMQHMCDDIAVMYLGRIMEQASRVDLFRAPLHPYTRALLSAVPSTDPSARTVQGRIRLDGDPPSPIDPPPGCRFSGRCPFAEPRCRRETPWLREVAAGHLVACHRVADDGTPEYATGGEHAPRTVPASG